MQRAADWDASRYHQVARPHAAWGASVLDRLQLQGDELVLDAGCGSGRVTQQLLERLPDGHVIAADVSPAMLDQARKTLADYGDRVSFVETDLLNIDQALQNQRVDVVFSTATFHWIADHRRLFAALHTVLKPGGALIAQFGGGRNLAEFMQATDTIAQRKQFEASLTGKALWRFFYGPDETRQRLEQAGFTQADAWLEPSRQTFADRQALADFCRAVVLSVHLANLPEAQRDEFLNLVVDEIHRRQGGYILDYVRLNITASA